MNCFYRALPIGVHSIALVGPQDSAQPFLAPALMRAFALHHQIDSWREPTPPQTMCALVLMQHPPYEPWPGFLVMSPQQAHCALTIRIHETLTTFDAPRSIMNKLDRIERAILAMDERLGANAKTATARSPLTDGLGAHSHRGGVGLNGWDWAR